MDNLEKGIWPVYRNYYNDQRKVRLGALQASHQLYLSCYVSAELFLNAPAWVPAPLLGALASYVADKEVSGAFIKNCRVSVSLLYLNSKLLLETTFVACEMINHEYHLQNQQSQPGFGASRCYNHYCFCQRRYRALHHSNRNANHRQFFVSIVLRFSIPPFKNFLVSQHNLHYSLTSRRSINWMEQLSWGSFCSIAL